MKLQAIEPTAVPGTPSSRRFATSSRVGVDGRASGRCAHKKAPAGFLPVRELALPGRRARVAVVGAALPDAAVECVALGRRRACRRCSSASSPSTRRRRGRVRVVDPRDVRAGRFTGRRGLRPRVPALASAESRSSRCPWAALAADAGIVFVGAPTSWACSSRRLYEVNGIDGGRAFVVAGVPSSLKEAVTFRASRAASIP